MNTQDNTSPVIAAATAAVDAALSETESTVNRPGVDNSTETCLGEGGVNRTTVDIVGGTQAAADSAAGATEGTTEGSTESTTEAPAAPKMTEQRRKLLSISMPMLALAFVLLLSGAWLAGYGMVALMVALFGPIWGSLLGLGLLIAFEFWLFTSKASDKLIGKYFGLFVKADDVAKRAAQALAAAAVAADFAAQAPAEAAAFEAAASAA